LKEERAEQRQSATLPKEGEKGFQAVCGSNDSDIGRARDIVAIERYLRVLFLSSFSHSAILFLICFAAMKFISAESAFVVGKHIKVS
jgi:hypothetical protein